MRKVLATALVLAAAAALLGLLSFGDRKAIARAEAEQAELHAQRDSLLAVVAEHQATRDTLTRQRAATEAVIGRLRDSVTHLERDRQAAQRSVRAIRTTGALMDRFRAAFPALGAGVGLTTVPLPDDTLGLEVLMVPAWFTETFIIDRANAASWRAQRDGLLAVDSLRAAVTVLQDSLTRLARAEGNAYRTGYDAALQAYGALHVRHLAELRRPRVQVGSAVSFLLGAGTVVVVTRLVR